MSKPVRKRHADDRRAGEPKEHTPDRDGAAVFGHERRRDERRYAEIGPMRQSAQKAKHEQPRVAGRDRTQAVADCEHRHERDQQRTAVLPGPKHRQGRRAHHYAECVGADGVAGRGRIDPEALGKKRQQAHRREFGCSDRETTHGKRQDNEACSLCGGGVRHGIARVISRLQNRDCTGSAQNAPGIARARRTEGRPRSADADRCEAAAPRQNELQRIKTAGGACAGQPAARSLRKHGPDAARAHAPGGAASPAWNQSIRLTPNNVACMRRIRSAS